MNDALESVSCKPLFSDAKLEKLRPILALKLRHYSKQQQQAAAKIPRTEELRKLR